MKSCCTTMVGKFNCKTKLSLLMSIYYHMIVICNFACRKCEGYIGEAVEQEKKLCDEVGTVMEFAYLDGRVCADGGCEATVTART